MEEQVSDKHLRLLKGLIKTKQLIRESVKSPYRPATQSPAVTAGSRQEAIPSLMDVKVSPPAKSLMGSSNKSEQVKPSKNFCRTCELTHRPGWCHQEVVDIRYNRIQQGIHKFCPACGIVFPHAPHELCENSEKDMFASEPDFNRVPYRPPPPRDAPPKIKTPPDMSSYLLENRKRVEKNLECPLD
jgi:hypothetical protein